MSRRYALLPAVLGIMVAIAALAQKQTTPQKLLVLDWAGKAPAAAPPTAVLIEMGLKDAQAKPWSGQATVTGAKVVHREGYRFRKGDKLVEPVSWEASSHRPLRAPPKSPQVTALEPVATVGVVLDLADIQPDASLTLTIREHEIDKVQVPLKEVLAGQTKSLADGHLVVRRISTAVPVYTGPTEDDFPAACYGPDGTLWLAWIAYHVREEDRRIEAPNLKTQPKDFKAFYTPGFADQLVVKYFRNGKWSDPYTITDKQQDLMRCAIAVGRDGVVRVAYSAHRDGKFDMYSRALTPQGNLDPQKPPVLRLGAEERVTDTDNLNRLPGMASNVNPVMVTAASGDVHVGWQARNEQGFGAINVFQRGASWTLEHSTVSKEAAAMWYPALAAGPDGSVAVAYDLYAGGDYDVHLLVRKGKEAPKPYQVAASSRYEARPSICYDIQGRLWIAYEEGPEQWGKNFGPLDERGNPMYFARTVKVVCLENGKLMRPVAELPPLPAKMPAPDTGQKAEGLPRYSYPKIGIDGKGRIWLTYRQKFGTRYSTHPGSYWLTFARRLDGDQWSPPIELHHSDGLLDSRPVLLPHPAGGLRVIHNTDGRLTTPDSIDNQIYMSYVDLPGGGAEPKLVPHDPDKKDDKLLAQAKAEQAAVQRCRDYRIDAGGKKYQLLRGEFHRHTEISWDGGPDGSLEDMWRYAIDCAGMDWIGNGDHDNGAGREYPWWLIQKTTDAYQVANHFTPMFTYERSVSYPHGHRNCMFAKRGVRTLPRLAEPDPEKRVAGIHADDTKMLYRYLKELDGVCASHTSATGMGTDWRDNDPAVEPFVEIYQGDRMSYEKQEAPRAGYEPKSGKKPANIAGWYPKGYINLALDKGFRLGFQSSSDHTSTHISYCFVVAERHDRTGILDAIKKRHVYAATDDIVLDVRSGNHIVGEEFKATGAPKLEIRVHGTAPLAKVEVIKDSDVIETFKPGKEQFQTTWTDPKPTPGVHYYYVRVQQEDTNLAWGSPMWIEVAK